MSALYLQALGGLRLTGPSGELLTGRKKELALLAYVARRAPRPVPRAELVDLLWGDRPDASARHSLRQALVHLKQAGNGVVVVEPRQVVLAPGRLELDVAAFEADLAAGRLEEAVERWRGEFLAGADDVGGEPYRLWVETERQALRKRLNLAFERLVAAQGAPHRAAHWAARWTEAMPLDERPQAALIEALARAGRLDDALACHAAFITRLQEALELQPSDAFLHLGRDLERRARPRAMPRLSPGSIALFTPDLVGRGTALDELDHAWHAARSGTATVVLVEGEEGVGKTRLCEEFLRSLRERTMPSLVLRARAHEPTRDAPGGVLRELLGELRDAPGLVASPGGALAALRTLVPAIGERVPAPAAPTAWPAVEALAEVLRTVGAELPVVLFLDDFPAADRTTQDFLVALAERLRAARVLTLLTAQSGDAASSATWAALHRLYGLRLIRLQPLDAGHVERLLASMLQMRDDDRHALATRLHRESGGNPFYLIQLMAALLDEGHLVPDPDGSWRPAAAPEGPFPAPFTLREAIGRRLVQLSDPARGLVEAAAVLGQPAEAALLAEIAGYLAPDVDPAIEELLAKRILRLATTTGSYDFPHEVTRKVVYQAIPGPRRHELQQRAQATAAARGREAEERAAARYREKRAGTGPRPRVAWVAAGVVLAALTALVLAHPWRAGRQPDRIAGVTTASVAAYRLYQQGLRAVHEGDRAVARRLLHAALDEDPSFAMAVYHLARLTGETADWDRALALSQKASERERLLIRGQWMFPREDPARLAVAETLVARYPDDADGHGLLAGVLLWDGQFLDAVPHFERVIALDSLGWRGEDHPCRACEAAWGLIDAYVFADSLAAGERVARTWVERHPTMATAWDKLSGVLQNQGRYEEALAAWRTAANLRDNYDPTGAVAVLLRTGGLTAAERALRDKMRNTSPVGLRSALWDLAIVLRYQGRLREALSAALELRRLSGAENPEATWAPYEAIAHAQVLHDLGRYREAAALWDSLAADVRRWAESPGVLARNTVWMRTHQASALAGADDTAALRLLADTIESLGQLSAFGRDRRLHHYVRGLWLQRQRRYAEAAAAHRRAMFGRAFFTRTNLELGRALIDAGRPWEAIVVLRAGVTSGPFVWGLYVTGTEFHELLGRAFERAGEPDSAAAHYHWVVEAWSRSDPELRPRLDAARQRLNALRHDD